MLASWHWHRTSAVHRLEKNLGFFKKKQPTSVFLLFFLKKKNGFFLFFEKKQDFVLFSKKTEKPHFELFLFLHTMSLFSELHNDNLLYLIWHSKLRVKKCTRLWFCNVLLVSSLLNGKAWQACAQETERNHLHTNSTVSRQVYVHAPLVQYL